MKLYRIPTAAGIDSLTLAEAETPRPKRGQVLIRVRATSLNYRDLMVVKGQYGRGGVPENIVPLSDGAGEVVEIGEDVERVKAGDRVAGIFMQNWLAGPPTSAHAASALGGAIDGMLSEYVVLDQNGLVPIPDHMSFEEAATLPCAAVTAWNALFGGRPLKPGETVLVLGSGGVSLFALQFARMTGARVIATSSSDEKIEKLKAFGASDCVNYRARPDWDKAVRDLTGDSGVDHVVEVGGPGTLPLSIDSVRIGGSIALIGVLSDNHRIDPSPILRKSINLRGIYVGSREMFEAMNRAIATQEMRPVIDRVFPFAEAQDAYRLLESQKHLGKIVVCVGD
ncbi:NADPH:quinone reductase [Faunimonas pinastri]|uniref:NADPH:quinone reductase n=1 Tax=Faunimonas pinastri TaxID=1855383 RepID=A0A1H9P3E2_9HYPH|nr:NAD(P)-dependent alcohol dehydrogenase [Faunimonas pinastri]SER42641.1 NADPH:quinone reductase [Faunimonas pinastri]